MNIHPNKEIFNTIKNEAENIIIKNLTGITKQSSFDLNKINYIIDKDTLPYRIENITNNIVNLIITTTLPLITKQIEQEIKNKIKKSLL